MILCNFYSENIRLEDQLQIVIKSELPRFPQETIAKKIWGYNKFIAITLSKAKEE